MSINTNRYLVAGSEEGCAYLFDLRRVAGPMAKLRRDRLAAGTSSAAAAVTDVAFNPDGREIVAAAHDGQVVVLKY